MQSNPEKIFNKEYDFDTIIKEASKIYNVPFGIIKGVIAAESNFKPTAYRAEPRIQDASRGLMQLLLRTAKGLGFNAIYKELYKPDVNINLGTKFLRDLFSRYSDWKKAIVSYNMGSPRLAKNQTAIQAQIYGKAKPDWIFANEPYLRKVLSYGVFYEQREMDRILGDYTLSNKIAQGIKKKQFWILNPLKLSVLAVCLPFLAFFLLGKK